MWQNHSSHGDVGVQHGCIRRRVRLGTRDGLGTALEVIDKDDAPSGGICPCGYAQAALITGREGGIIMAAGEQIDEGLVERSCSTRKEIESP